MSAIIEFVAILCVALFEAPLTMIDNLATYPSTTCKLIAIDGIGDEIGVAIPWCRSLAFDGTATIRIGWFYSWR